MSHMNVDGGAPQSVSTASASSGPVPATPNGIAGIIAAVSDPLQYGGQSAQGHTQIPGFQSGGGQ